MTMYLVLRELDRVELVELQPTADGLDVEAASERTTPVEGLLVLRPDSVLYTANVRSAHRQMLERVDAERPRVLIVDCTTQSAVPVSVIDQFPDLERELERRDVTLWVAALPPRALATARMTPRWQDFVDAGRVFPTTLAAVKAFVS